MNDHVARVTLDLPGGESSNPGTEETTSPSERRRNTALRGLIDGLLDHVRDLSNRVEGLSPEELEDARQRFNWTAELMWAAITDEKNRTDY